MNNRLKYEKAYDYATKSFVKPEDILDGSLHDPLRYFSRLITEDEYNSGDIENCDVLTTNRGCTYTNKKGTNVKVQRFFTKIGVYNREFKDTITRKISEATIQYHKIAEDIFNTIQELGIDIQIDTMYCSIGGCKIPIMCNSRYRVKEINSTEKAIKDISRIPDIIAKIQFTDYNGNIRYKDIAIEIYFTHEVDSSKRDEYQNKGVSCIEINIWDIVKSNIDDYKLNLLKLLCKNGVWISSPIIDYFKNDCVEISSRTILRKSNDYETTEKNRRYYFFKDDFHALVNFYKSEIDTDCMNTQKKSINYGECKNCSNCIYFKDSDNINEVLILCDRYNRKLGNGGLEYRKACIQKYLEDH